MTLPTFTIHIAAHARAQCLLKRGTTWQEHQCPRSEHCFHASTGLQTTRKLLFDRQWCWCRYNAPCQLRNAIRVSVSAKGFPILLHFYGESAYSFYAPNSVPAPNMNSRITERNSVSLFDAPFCFVVSGHRTRQTLTEAGTPIQCH